MTIAGKKWMFIGAILIGCGLIGTVAAVFALSKLKGDEAVLNDINRHFESYDDNSGVQAVGLTSNDEAVASGAKRSPFNSTATPESKIGATIKKSTEKKGRRKRNRKKKSKTLPSNHPAATAWTTIRQVGPTTFEIASSLAESARGNPRQYIPGVTASIAEADGSPAGFRLVGIGPGSALAALGLRNGDILTTVNGFSLKTVDEALLAAGAAKFAEKFRIDILRNGIRRSHYYRIVKFK